MVQHDDHAGTAFHRFVEGHHRAQQWPVDLDRQEPRRGLGAWILEIPLKSPRALGGGLVGRSSDEGPPGQAFADPLVGQPDVQDNGLPSERRDELLEVLMEQVFGFFVIHGVTVTSDSASGQMNILADIPSNKKDSP